MLVARTQSQKNKRKVKSAEENQKKGIKIPIMNRSMKNV